MLYGALKVPAQPPMVRVHQDHMGVDTIGTVAWADEGVL